MAASGGTLLITSYDVTPTLRSERRTTDDDDDGGGPGSVDLQTIDERIEKQTSKF